jgi:hypothetical protein
MRLVHGVHVPTLEIWEPQLPGKFRVCPTPVQEILYLLSHISGYKLMKHPTLQLSGFSCIILTHCAVAFFAVKQIEGNYSACQNT